MSAERKRRKRLVVAYLLWAALGPVGAHRFYLGLRVSGAALLALTLAGAALHRFLAGALLLLAALAWCLADGFLIPGMARAPLPDAGEGSLRKGRP
jgi:TM2 domain-containing membrane protein YozV